MIPGIEPSERSGQTLSLFLSLKLRDLGQLTSETFSCLSHQVLDIQVFYELLSSTQIKYAFIFKEKEKLLPRLSSLWHM